VINEKIISEEKDGLLRISYRIICVVVWRIYIGSQVQESGKIREIECHAISYTVIPIIAGVLFIVIGLSGGSIFDS
jgi:hypothetical protein